MLERTTATIRRAWERRGLPSGPIELDSFPQFQTRAQWHAGWAMSLYKRGEAPRVARKHAWRALRRGPLTYEAWRAFLYVFGGRGVAEPIRRIMAAKRRGGKRAGRLGQDD
jgi:hypothetical protein